MPGWRGSGGREDVWRRTFPLFFGMLAGCGECVYGGVCGGGLGGVEGGVGG
jgi:hypothetical protein